MPFKSAFNQNPAFRFLVSRLPGRMRRLVFLASLAGVAKTRMPDDALIRKLNQVLQLSTANENALKLPIHISSMIWSNKKVFEQEIKTLAECERIDDNVRNCAETIAQSTPTWLVGDNLTLVIKDILDLFTKDGSPFTGPKHSH